MRLKKSQPLYQQLQEKLQEYIRLERPVLLPTEREIMEQYGVSRKTVRSAVAEMVKSGNVTPVRGKGTVVNLDRHHSHISPPVILIDSFETIPPYEYEIYLAVKKRLNEDKIIPSIQLIDPKSTQIIDQLRMVPPGSRILLFSRICNRPEVYDYFHDRLTDILCIGFKPLYPYNCCHSDLHDGFHKITAHLIKQGHRRIALLCLKRDQERFNAFIEAHHQAGLAFDPHLHIDASGTRHDGYQAIRQLLEQHLEYSAIIAHNDLCALGILEGLLQQGIKVPEQLSLAGCDNLTDAKFFPVPLTTVGHDHEIYVETARDFLLKPPSNPVSQIIPMHLINRNSVKENK